MGCTSDDLFYRQNAVVGVYHKRNPFGIVVRPTAQRGLLLGMCGECRVITIKLLADSCYTRKLLTLHILKECTTTGRYIRYLISETELVDTSYRVTTTDE